MQIFSTCIIELAVASALLSLFLEFCFREGNIFSGWLEFLYEQSVPGKIRQELQNFNRDDRFDHITWFWFKPLGGCVVCMNVWVSAIACIPYWWNIHTLLCPPLGVLLVIVLSSFIVRITHERLL